MFPGDADYRDKPGKLVLRRLAKHLAAVVDRPVLVAKDDIGKRRLASFTVIVTLFGSFLSTETSSTYGSFAKTRLRAANLSKKNRLSPSSMSMALIISSSV